jgi:hypothetical protein
VSHGVHLDWWQARLGPGHATRDVRPRIYVTMALLRYRAVIRFHASSPAIL